MPNDAQDAGNDAEAVDAALAILCLVTGEDWDRAKLVEQSATLKDVAVHTLKKQGLSDGDAQMFVEDRWQAFAADIPQEEVVPLDPVPAKTASAAPAGLGDTGPSPSTQPGGDLWPTANLGPISSPIPGVGELRDRLGDYRLRKGLVTETGPNPLAGDPGLPVVPGETSSPAATSPDR